MNWKTLWLRDIEWQQLEALQNEHVERTLSDPNHACILISEPHPTYTHGRSADPHDLVWPRSKVQAAGISIHPVSRGGKWTYHGPGQIVTYPIFSLPTAGYHVKAIRKYLENLRNSLIDVLVSIGLSPESQNSPFGVYIEGRKLASFGIAVRHGVSMHGFALYLRAQQHEFSGIHPCGAAGCQVTSLEEQGIFLNWESTAHQITESIKNCFH